MSILTFRAGIPWDGDWALLQYDSFTRTAVWIKDAGDEWLLRTDQYGSEDAIEPNAEFEKASHGIKYGDWVRIASVPNILAQQNEIDEKLRQGDNKALSRFFNDPANRKLRTSRGKV